MLHHIDSDFLPPVVEVHPSARLAEFRTITADPDQHPEEAVIAACDALMLWGDWMDFERGRLLLREITARTALELNRRARRRMVLMKAGTFVASVALGVGVAAALQFCLAILNQ